MNATMKQYLAERYRAGINDVEISEDLEDLEPGVGGSDLGYSVHAGTDADGALIFRGWIVNGTFIADEECENPGPDNLYIALRNDEGPLAADATNRLDVDDAVSVCRGTGSGNG